MRIHDNLYDRWVTIDFNKLDVDYGEAGKEILPGEITGTQRVAESIQTDNQVGSTIHVINDRIASFDALLDKIKERIIISPALFAVSVESVQYYEGYKSDIARGCKYVEGVFFSRYSEDYYEGSQIIYFWKDQFDKTVKPDVFVTLYETGNYVMLQNISTSDLMLQKWKGNAHRGALMPVPQTEAEEVIEEWIETLESEVDRAMTFGVQHAKCKKILSTLKILAGETDRAPLSISPSKLDKAERIYNGFKYEYIGKPYLQAAKAFRAKGTPHYNYKKGDSVVVVARPVKSKNLYYYTANYGEYTIGDIIEVQRAGRIEKRVVEQIEYYSKGENPFPPGFLPEIIGKIGDAAVSEEKRKATTLEKEILEAHEARAKSERMSIEAIRAKAEADEKAAEALRAETAARRARANLEKAEEDAAKTWIKDRPETDNPVLLQIRGIQDAIDYDEDIYNALYDLEQIMRKLIEKGDKIYNDPDATISMKNDVEDLYSFYFPKMISVLDSYREICLAGLTKKKASETRESVLKTIRSCIDSYEIIMESLYSKDMMKLSVEMEALRTRLAIDGFTKSDFDIV